MVRLREGVLRGPQNLTSARMVTNADTVPIAIVGAGGRMGRMLVQAVCAEGDMSVAAAVEREDAPHLGADAGTVAASARSV